MKWQNNKRALTLLLSLFVLPGCAQNTEFSPPVNGENIRFTATIPGELEAAPLYAIYRSDLCRDERRNSNGEPYTVPGRHRERYPLTLNAADQAEAHIPESGGGKCDWKLSNIKFEVKLKDPSSIDQLISPSKNFEAEATFVFDNNAPATFDGGYEKRSGNVNEKLTLFPLISENFIGGHDKSFRLIKKYETMTYKVKNANNININVDYKSDMKSFRMGVKKKTKGAKPTMTYPNGDIVYGEDKPQYKKLIEISESMSSK